MRVVTLALSLLYTLTMALFETTAIRLKLAWPRGCFENCVCFAYAPRASDARMELEAESKAEAVVWKRAYFGQSGWCGDVLPCLPHLGLRFESHQGHYVDWVFSPYLAACVFPGIVLGFPSTSKTETFSLSSLQMVYYYTAVLLRKVRLTANNS